MIRLSEVVLPAYYEFWNTKKTYVCVKGSRGSGKSKHAALWHIYQMMRLPKSNTLVVRKTERTLRDSCYSDLRWAIHQLGVDAYWNCTVNPLEITYIPTGQKILFRGLDDGYKITSISVPYGVLNFLWLEEFYEISHEEDFDILDESIRGEMPEGLWKRVTMTFNPWSDKHFAKKRFFDVQSDSIYSLTTTYQDNPYLSEDDRQLFEDMKVRNPRRYRVAGLGDWGVVDGLVFENWEEENFDIQTVLKSDGDAVFGLDFGFSQDPTAFVCAVISESEGKIYIFDEMYQKALTNREIYSAIESLGYAKERIIADSAEPKSIEELRQYGLYRIRPARKGRDSILSGLQWIQNFKIVIHPRCTNFITEISNYSWDEDRFGNKINRPIDEFNHLIDALRYACESHQRGATFSFE